MGQLTADPDTAAALLRGLSANPAALQQLMASLQQPK